MRCNRPGAAGQARQPCLLWDSGLAAARSLPVTHCTGSPPLLRLLSEAFQTWVLWSVVTGELSGNQGGQGNLLVKRGAKSWPEGVCVGG